MALSDLRRRGAGAWSGNVDMRRTRGRGARRTSGWSSSPTCPALRRTPRVPAEKDAGLGS
ncbi:hypothetical protein QJS66_14025 [Kocuria rhizophila]|nr:hypothetical protein QJS66_14025 [Kocuria rhizophila]